MVLNQAGSQFINAYVAGRESIKSILVVKEKLALNVVNGTRGIA